MGEGRPLADRMQVESEDTQWYVARIKPAQTNRALTSLDRAGIEFCFPMFSIHGIEEPLIRGYVFPRLQFNEDLFAFVNSMNGIDRLLPFGADKPSAIDDDWMDSLQVDLCNGSFNIEPQVEQPLPRFNRSEILAIISGPFAGHTGTFVRVRKGAVDVDVAFFGRMTTITLQGHQIQRLM